MYPSLAGVVIPDDDDGYEVTFRPQQYGDETADQVLYAQQYGDDGIRDGAEGLGVEQARRLKRKLGRNRRRLRVGPSPYAVEAGSTYNFGFGIAPLVAVGAAKAGVGVLRSIGIGSKYTSATHVKRFAAAQGSNLAMARTLVDQAYSHAFLENIPDRDKWLGIYQAMQSIANPTMQAYMASKSARPTAQLPVTGPSFTPPTLLPTPAPVPGVPPPAPGGALDVTGRPAPYFPDVPSPIPPTAGGPPSASETVAAAAQEGGEAPPMRAGFGVDLKNPMVLLGLAAAAIFVVPQLVGGGKRRARR